MVWFLTPPPLADGETLALPACDDAPLGVRVRVNRRARRMTLRVAPTGAVTLTVPPDTPRRQAMELLGRKADWVAERLGRLPPPIPFADGAEIPLLGIGHIVCHRPRARGGVWREPGTIIVTGSEAHLARRVKDWLRAEASHHIAPRVTEKSARLGRRAGRVTVRETRSRWGSCAANGNLSFCWRLVLAPEPVLDYVVAHEVAHLAIANHGPAFWRAVEKLTGDVSTARAWLDSHGPGLMRYGHAAN